MKNLILILAVSIAAISHSQELKSQPQITVNGEGKVKVIPDQSLIVVAIETKGNFVKEVKKANDLKIDAVLKFIKRMNISPADFKIQSVSLNPQYDYEKKKHSYNASQTIEILLRDLTKYDELMEGLVDEGINRIDNVSFQSSKMTQYQSEARKLAMKEAKNKAEDYVSVLGQKVGKAITILDNSQAYYPQPMYSAMKLLTAADSQTSRETMALGEINITANVNVSFILE